MSFKNLEIDFFSIKCLYDQVELTIEEINLQ